MNKLIILDRDGVINHDSDDYIKSPTEWIPIEGSLEAIARLTNAGYIITIATNQSGLARKLFDIDTLVDMHNKMHRLVSELGGKIDGIFFCPHSPRHKCACRKPRPGLLQEISRRYHISLEGVPVVGDSVHDLQAAMAVNANPYLVRTGKDEHIHTRLGMHGLDHIPVFDDLASVTSFLLDQ